MPLLKLETTVDLTEEKRTGLLKSLSRIVAEVIGKPESYVMVSAAPAAMLMAGESGNAAFVDIRSIGALSPEVNRKLSKGVCTELSETLAIPSDRIYLNFSELGAAEWGWKGSTFG